MNGGEQKRRRPASCHYGPASEVFCVPSRGTHSVAAEDGWGGGGNVHRFKALSLYILRTIHCENSDSEDSELEE